MKIKIRKVKGGDKMKKRNLIVGIVVVLIVGLLIGGYFTFFHSSWKFTEDRPIKIVWIDSYHHDRPSSIDKFNSFRDMLLESGREFEFEDFEMDTKRNPDGAEQKGKEAQAFIDSRNPDVIYLTDDNAQKYVGSYYIGKDVLIIASGIDGDPKDYGYLDADNVAGVVEKEHFVGSIRFLQEIDPQIQRVAVIGDNEETTKIAFDYAKEESKKMDDVDFVGWEMLSDFEEFKERVLYYQERADAFFFLGLSALQGTTEDDTIRWITENNNLLETTFTAHLIGKGLLASLDASAIWQGKAAGNIAKEILIDGKNPSSFNFEAPKKGDQILNYARAKQLGLIIPSTILINSKVFEEFPWEIEE